MKIEISNKSFIICIVAIIAIIAAFIIGFNMGTPKEESESEFMAEDLSNYHFYNNAPSNDNLTITFHSDPNCFHLKGEVYRDSFALRYFHSDSNDDFEIIPHNYCNLCMDSQKIEICEKKINEVMGWDKD